VTVEGQQVAAQKYQAGPFFADRGEQSLVSVDPTVKV
jgi:hypothetical protein